MKEDEVLKEKGGFCDSALDGREKSVLEIVKWIDGIGPAAMFALIIHPTAMSLQSKPPPIYSTHCLRSEQSSILTVFEEISLGSNFYVFASLGTPTFS
ncbi:hypothetical protein Tco_0570482 [Tanacetum coccineum]